MKWLVRTNCEYSRVVEAETAEEALVKAGKVPLDDWEHAWAPAEAELEAQG